MSDQGLSEGIVDVLATNRIVITIGLVALPDSLKCKWLGTPLFPIFIQHKHQSGESSKL